MKKVKFLYFVIFDEVVVICVVCCEKKVEMLDKVIVIGSFVWELLNELKVRIVVK